MRCIAGPVSSHPVSLLLEAGRIVNGQVQQEKAREPVLGSLKVEAGGGGRGHFPCLESGLVPGRKLGLLP